ncbi:PREDICTED: uncharacterized protein LOC106115573 [Papilio xuthus]|uniref:Uncharacterized protein LOC106115573 n=1 Tax=Papilio xuthus TaxID=66420 RepID=A0AAJ6Z358_PAPXU|nr:PREDICTED: uncharacterized protein LOC106115573 [Papilio xuthus]
MDRLLKCQEDLKSRIVRNKTNFGKQSKDRITLSNVETRLDNLEECWTSFKEGHQRIIFESEGTEFESSDYYKSDRFEEVEEIYIEFKSKLKGALANLRATTLTTQSSKSEAKVSYVRLPKIDIPTFSGKYVEWTSFRDLFVSLIHNNPSLDDVQRLHYLKSHLQGEAEQLLRHIPITADNYTTCWAQLESRYNNKKFLANCILKRFMNQRNITVESSSAIKELLDITNECLHALENLGVDVTSWDILVIYIVSQKLDPESRKLWENLINDCSNKLPELSQFRTFLENRFRALECLGSNVVDKPGNTKPKKATALHVTAPHNASCIFCIDKGHKLFNCKRFAQEDVDNRRSFAQTSGLCFNCLNTGHSVYTCRQSTKCHLCRRRHHTLLHPKSIPRFDNSSPGQPIGSDVVASEAASSSAGESTRAMTCFAKASTHVLLATALINVESRTGSLICLRSLLDQGSQASFISESAVQLLGLKRHPIKTVVSGLGGDPQASLSCRFMVSMKIQSRHDPSFVIYIKAHVMNKVTSLLPDRKIVVPMLPSLSCEVLADPSFGTPNKIDILLGAEVYSQILLQGLIRGPPGYPLAQNTKFGWILSGEVKEAGAQLETCHNVVVSLHSAHSDESELLRKFWELESDQYDIEKTYLTEEEQLCEKLFAVTTRRDESGRYVVNLPFRTPDPKCKYGHSKQIAQKRFLILEKRFLRDPDMKKGYVKVINEYLDLGHMEKVEDKEKTDAVYLPHHAVVRNDNKGADFPLASNRVLKDFYVDDLMTGCQNVEEGIKIYHEMKNLLGRGGFELQRWSTNNSELLDHIQKDHRQATREHLELKTDTVSKILGLTWNRSSDEFEYTVNLPPLETPVTKRRVISDIAKMFDPLGWTAPAIITAKVFIQRLWLSGIDWDQELPSSLMKDWLNYREELKQLIQMWKQGPEFLKQKNIDYKREVADTTIKERKLKCHTTTSIIAESSILTKYSSSTRLTRVVAYCRRFFSLKSSGTLKAEELGQLNTCIKLCQRYHFQEEIDNLKKHGKRNKKSRLTFVGSAKRLKAMFNTERSTIAAEIAEWCATNSIEWHFIPPHSPNFGGLWEAGVKSTKHHLRRIVGNITLTFEEMTTLLSQIEAYLNSRPISQLPTYPDDPYPLTPGHFLVREPLVVVPDRNYGDTNISSLKRWHLTQRMLQVFWRTWSQEYLTQLQHRYKWTDQVAGLKIGDVVLIRKDDLPPAKWLFGIITEKHTGLDGLTRVVSVRCKGSVIKRPLSKLVVLPVA